MTRLSRRFTVITSLLAVVMACAFAPLNSFAGTTTSRFIVFHASPDAPNIDVYANGKLISADLAFGYFDGVFTVPSGDYKVQIYAAGADPSKDKPVIDQTQTLEPGTDYNLILAGNLADLSLLVIAEPSAPKRGYANVRIVNLTPGSPAIDLVDETKGPLVAGVAFKQDKLETLTTGNYVLSLHESGTTNVLEDYGPVTLQSRNYTVYYLAVPAVAAKAVKPNAKPTKRMILKTFGKK